MNAALTKNTARWRASICLSSLIFILSCGTTSTELDLLLALDVTTTDFSTAVETKFTKKSKTTHTGKPRGAIVVRELSPRADTVLEDVFDEVLVYLDQQSWKPIEIRTVAGRRYVATRAIKNDQFIVGVTNATRRNIISIDVVHDHNSP